MPRSVAVILRTDGARLDVRALGEIPLVDVERLQLAEGTRATAATATVRHECARRDLIRVLREWARIRGWAITVAPLPGRD